MRILIEHLHLDDSLKSSLLALNRNIKNFENIIEIYQRFSDLVIEMIQGTSHKNFDNFYKKLPDGLSILNETGQISNYLTLESFIFIKKSIEIQSLLFDNKNVFDTLSLPMKHNLFVTINNVINQELADFSLVKIFITTFNPEKIIELVSKYVRGLYIKHFSKIDYNDKKFKRPLKI